VLSVSTGRAGGEEAGLTLAVVRRVGAERQRRCIGGGRRRGREGSGERPGGPVARSGGEGGGCSTASERRGKSRRGGENSASGGGVPFLKWSRREAAEGGGERVGRHMERSGGEREGGLGCSGDSAAAQRHAAVARSRRAWAAALTRYNGGRRDARD
jgi:hypothetical protein